MNSSLRFIFFWFRDIITIFFFHPRIKFFGPLSIWRRNPVFPLAISFPVLFFQLNIYFLQAVAVHPHRIAILYRCPCGVLMCKAVSVLVSAYLSENVPLSSLEYSPFQKNPLTLLSLASLPTAECFLGLCMLFPYSFAHIRSWSFSLASAGLIPIIRWTERLLDFTKSFNLSI